MNALGRLWREHRLELLAFAVAALATLFFAVRMVVFTLYWADPAHHEQTIEGWMTPRYVARSWHVAPEVVTDALGRPSVSGKPATLKQISKEQGVPVEKLIARVDLAIEAAHARQP